MQLEEGIELLAVNFHPKERLQYLKLATLKALAGCQLL